MIRIFGSAAFLTIALTILACSQILSSKDVLVELRWDTSTLASAIEESRRISAACGSGEGQSSCEPKAPSLHQLAYEKLSCGGGKLGGTLLFGWRIANELSDGTSFIKRAKTLASSRQLVDCSGKLCLAVVPTTSDKGPEPNVETLSVCSVQLVAGRAGPPEHCTEMAKLGQNESLIKSVIGRSTLRCLVGRRDFDVVFPNLANNAESVRRTVGEVLVAKPFSLSIEREGDAVLGTRSFLPSGIFQGWREWIIVRVSLAPVSYDAHTRASIATTILVSKQNTTSRESWTPSSEQQESAYLSALKKEFVKRGAVIETLSTIIRP